MKRKKIEGMKLINFLILIFFIIFVLHSKTTKFWVVNLLWDRNFDLKETLWNNQMYCSLSLHGSRDTPVFELFISKSQWLTSCWQHIAQIQRLGTERFQYTSKLVLDKKLQLFLLFHSLIRKAQIITLGELVPFRWAGVRVLLMLTHWNCFLVYLNKSHHYPCFAWTLPWPVHFFLSD